MTAPADDTDRLRDAIARAAADSTDPLVRAWLSALADAAGPVTPPVPASPLLAA